MNEDQLHQIVQKSDDLMDIFLKDIEKSGLVEEYKIFGRLGVLAAEVNAREIMPHPAFLAGQWMTKYGYKQLSEQRKLLEASLKTETTPKQLDWD